MTDKHAGRKRQTAICRTATEKLVLDGNSTSVIPKLPPKLVDHKGSGRLDPPNASFAKLNGPRRDPKLAGAWTKYACDQTGPGINAVCYESTAVVDTDRTN